MRDFELAEQETKEKLKAERIRLAKLASGTPHSIVVEPEQKAEEEPVKSKRVGRKSTRKAQARQEAMDTAAGEKAAATAAAAAAHSKDSM
ncbi:hypothetical protein Pmar_PMAR010605 [Perkinsus marinus ATCC 50983]|uniref:Uncharacterized protein n=1 Tax=Perkinsus marinus (strain ATCC 50983 / TXsc) TaxID=423536 RepID=C5KYM0_PERM5|nr:hypothetical protein Pmar_PMAR010605 [Perkinsus marinus ATCC 50983]EER10423.1 hypothetical protein Pmar_PMAR010605 [Perkinsus marinus ATCC 50983]|eukprot:XP_002778628.1 hypothetical protein Pmar_PMAR010605 [Perkinsus marinus ATCC 50983]